MGIVVEIVSGIFHVQALHGDEILPFDERIAFQVSSEYVSQITPWREKRLVYGGVGGNEVARLRSGNVSAPSFRPGHVHVATKATIVLRRVLGSHYAKRREPGVQLARSIPQIRRVKFLRVNVEFIKI